MIIKDYMNSLSRDISLVEQKKLQWAKEREELAKMEQYHSNSSQKFEKTSIRTQFMADSKMIEKQFQQKNFNYSNSRRIRSPSLPPINRQNDIRQSSNKLDQSSGYKSSHLNLSNGGLPVSTHDCRKILNTTDSSSSNCGSYEYNVVRFDKKCLMESASSSTITDDTSTIDNDNDNDNDNENENEPDNEHCMQYVNLSKCGTPSSTTSSVASHDVFSISSSYANSSNIDANCYKAKEGGSGRAKWGSYMFDSYAREGRASRNGGPVWLEKSLGESRDSEEETMSISVRSVSSFLRGQNAPVDPFIMAERENKRRKAMELQNAIKEQLQERELLKKMEKEKRLREERMEEERLKKQMQMEQERLERERRQQMEKQENEKRKQETMRLALEKAEFDAKILREKKKRERALANQADLNETISIEKMGERTEIYMEGCQKNNKERQKEHDITEKMQRLAMQPNIEEDEDGDSYLIGTPIKLKKKSVDMPRKKTIKKQTNVDKGSSDEETVASSVRSPSISMSTSTDSSTTMTTSSTSEQSSLKPPVKEPKQTAGQKMLADLDGIALILQTMTPLVPLATINNDLFGLNQYNIQALNQYNLALLAQQQLQSRLSTPIIIPQLPQQIPVIQDMIQRAPGTPDSSILSQSKSIIETSNRLAHEKPTKLSKEDSRDTGFESEGKSSPSSIGDKDSLLTLGSPNPKTPKLPDRSEKITEVQEKFGVSGNEESFVVVNKMDNLPLPVKHDAFTTITKVDFDHKPSSQLQQETIRVNRVNPRIIGERDEDEDDDADSEMSLTPDVSRKSVKPPKTPQIPHDGTFTKEEGTSMLHHQDAATCTFDSKEEVKVLTPQKYRASQEREKSTLESTGTQTESFLFCEYCCYHHHCHHVMLNNTETTTSTTCTTTKTENNMTTTTNQEIKMTTLVRSKSNDKNKLEDRPQWGVNKPRIAYIKASERDPFYVKNKRKRFVKKQDDKYDADSSICSHKDCPILSMNSTTSPILSRKLDKRRNICTEILPIKTDKNGRVYVLHEEATNNFLINEALKRHHQKQLSKIKSLDYDDRFYSLPKAGKDFQNIFG